MSDPDRTGTAPSTDGGREPRLGVDIGRVIIAGPEHSHEADTDFFTGDEQALLATPEIDGAVDALARLRDLFDGRVWLVSKCGPEVEARSLRWLDGHDFFARTGVDRTHVRFCRERHEKRIHCEELQLTHFVDDRPEVHDAIRDVVTHRYLFGPQSGPVPDHVHRTRTWAEAEQLIAGTLASR